MKCIPLIAELFLAAAFAFAQAPTPIRPGSPVASSVVNANFLGLYNGKVGNWKGNGAPGDFPFSLIGDSYTDQTNHFKYTCYQVHCTAVATNNWMLDASGGGGGTPGGSNNDVQVNNSGAFGGGRCTMDSAQHFTCTGSITSPAFLGSNNAASGQDYLQGLTSGGVAFGVADVAGTPIVYVLPTTNGIAGQSLQDSGLITCPTYATGGPTTCHQLIWASPGASGVSSITGDGSLITNVASFGAVTLGLGTAAAHKYLGNPTGSPATWTASSIVAADLPATTVNAVTNDTNISGSISGQTITLGWLSTLAAARMVNAGVHTGDAVGTFPAITLNTVNSNVGTFGDSTHVPQFVVNGKGLITAVSSVAITAGTGNAASPVTTTFSTTPTFTCPSSTAGTVVDFKLSTVLSANITSSTLASCTPGSILNFSFVQAAASAFTVAMPTGFSQACQVSGIFNAITNMSFVWDGTNAQLIACSVDRGPSILTEQAAPSGNPASGGEWSWGDSTGLFLRLKNSAGTIFQMAKELTSGNVRCAGGANTVDAACSAGQLLTVLGTVPIANGGTNGTDAADNGGIVWSNASQYKILAHTTTAGLALLSGNAATPAWSVGPPAQKFFGTAAPGSVAGNLPGDFFSDTTNHNDYWCNATSGTAAPACTSVTTGGWTQLNVGGSISGLTTNTLPKAASSTTVTNSTVTDDGTTISLATNFTVTEASGIPAKVAGITTTGLGVPVVGWKSNVTNQSANQNVTLATAPGAGDYEIHYNADMNTACTTGSNSVAFAFSWTDASNARTLTTGSLVFGTSQTTASYMSGIIPIHVGSGNVTYTSTITGTCATGTSTYDINVWLARAI